VTCIAFFSPVADWMNISKISNENTAMVIILLAAQVFINFQTGLIYGGLYCEGYYGLGLFIMNFVRLFEFICLAGALSMGFGPVQTAAAFTLGRLLGTVVMFKLVRRRTPWLTFGVRGIDKDTIRRLVSPSLSATAFPIGNAFNLQGVRIIVGMVIGPTAVAIFATLRTLTRLSLIVLRSVEQLVQPEIGIAYGKGDAKLMRKIHRNSCQVSFWGSLIVICGLVILGDRILFIWTGGHITMDSRLFIMLLFVALINSFWFMSLMVSYATNRHQQIAIAYILVNIMVVGISYGACRVFGLEGVAGMLIIAEVIMSLYVLPKSLNLVEDHWLKFVRAMGSPPWFLFDAFRKRVTIVNK